MHEADTQEAIVDVGSNLGEWLENQHHALLGATTAGSATESTLPRVNHRKDAVLPMPGATRTVEQIAEALRAAGGVVTAAAKMLQIHRATLYGYLAVCEELRNIRDEVDEEMLDIAEGQLKKLVIAGDREAIKFFLRCKGKARGWREAVAVTGENGGPVEVRDVRDLTTAQLEAIVRGETMAS